MHDVRVSPTYPRLTRTLSYGLAWNPLKMGHVLGASEDMTICHWYVV